MVIINSSDYVDKAEGVIKDLVEEAKRNARRPGDEKILTTSQLRKQLAMTAELSARAEKETAELLSRELLDQIEYLRVQFVYQAGREPLVKKFIEKAKILEILKEIKGRRDDFLTFCRYMEALVAFRKYYIKEDK